MRALLLFGLSVSLIACGDDDSAGGDDAGGGEDSGAVLCRADVDCSDAVYCNGVEVCAPSAAGADERGCVNPGAPCTEPGRSCDELGRRCFTECEVSGDADGDGVDSEDCGGGDCDDGNPNRFPGNEEVCDEAGLDEDCDPRTLGGVDDDGDGHIASMCCNGEVCGTDCDDMSAGTFVGAIEVCNGLDDDCDGTIDEGLPVEAYLPDCDRDNFGADDGEAVMGCSVPGDPPACDLGVWVVGTGDCNDGDANINPGNPEVCNNVDDNCDDTVDNMGAGGAFVCEAGEEMACTNGCGVSGRTLCMGCTAFAECTSDEICNHCDDDNDGNFNEERELSTGTDAPILFCGTQAGVGDCSPVSGGSDSMLFVATVLDGTSNDSAGAVWLNLVDVAGMAVDPAMGWGTIEFDVVLEATAVPNGETDAESPLGGWAVVFAREGGEGVGTPEDRGVPRDLVGGSVNWYWSYLYMDSPPGTFDQTRYHSHRGVGGGTPIRADGTGPNWNLDDGELLAGGSTGFDGQTTAVAQHLRIRYTPDDPITIANEERVEVTASTDGGNRVSVYAAAMPDGSPDPANDLPVGAPLVIGFTAGTYTDSGFTGPPPGFTFGVPVRATVELSRIRTDVSPVEYSSANASLTRGGICP